MVNYRMHTTEEPPATRVRCGETGQFGPRCTPLFYTALLTPPRRLNWSEIPGAVRCRVTLSRLDTGGAAQPQWSAFAVPNGKISWELPALDLTPGTLYAWHVEPLFAGDRRSRGGDDPDAPEGVRAPHPPPGMEARFWLLDADAMAHVKYSLGVLEQSPDPEFTLLAQAILLSEAGLFQDALRLVQQGAKSDPQSVQTLLADTALSVIYRQMEQNLTARSGLPACFKTWVRNREQYHRNRVRAQMVNAQMQAPSAANERGQRPDVFARQDAQLPPFLERKGKSNKPIAI